MASLELPLFWLGLALLFTHELDAVRRREWRLLFVLRHMPDAQAEPMFVALHLPLVFALLLASQPSSAWARIAISVFLVIHALLHWRLRHRPESNFGSALSQGLIAGAAGAGALHLLASFVR